jgi:hypothetical protein
LVAERMSGLAQMIAASGRRKQPDEKKPCLHQASG